LTHERRAFTGTPGRGHLANPAHPSDTVLPVEFGAERHFACFARAIDTEMHFMKKARARSLPRTPGGEAMRDFPLRPMARTYALILINSHRITRKISTWLMNIPCFSVCFRGKSGVKGDDMA
jgi:hypothetical protein